VTKYRFRKNAPVTPQEAHSLALYYKTIKEQTLTGYTVRYVVKDDVFEFDMDLSQKAYDYLCERLSDFKTDTKINQ
jgi:hypothetical protein